MCDNFGLYIHIPFCMKKCPYCDFFSVSKDQNEIEKYTTEMIKSVEHWSKKTDRTVTSVYFGGGTPNILGAENLCKILKSIKDNFMVSENAEITSELNPTYGEELNFKLLKSCGFNRLSFGMQSSNVEELKILGRKHSPEEVKLVVQKAQECGFINISLDLMLGIPKQTKNSLAKSIEFCKDCGVTHISAYILKVEENTPFYKKKAVLNIPDEDMQADLYSFACDELKNYGYYQYEISNFSKPNYESNHNLIYWQCEEYLGLGPSAHSFFEDKRFYYPRCFEDFYNNKTVFDCYGGNKEEYIMLNLRLNKGISFEKYKSRYNEEFPVKYISNARKLEKNKLVKFSDNGFFLTQNGFLLSNSVISNILWD